jgi:hypothetical protein
MTLVRDRFGCGLENLNSKQQHQSLFSLLLEIESRLRAEAGVDFLVAEQHELGKAKNHGRPVVENLSRYIE